MGSPTELHQARFVTKLQRLLTEGEFVSTYKFALPLSLARWATENPDWNEDSLLDVRALAPHFAELYWPHVQPFASPDPAPHAAEPRSGYSGPSDSDWSRILVQDRGQRTDHEAPRVLKEIRAARVEGAVLLNQLTPHRYEGLLGAIRRSIVEMLLRKLHRVRDSDAPMRFLYREGQDRQSIQFASGTVACLAHFAPLIEETARAAGLRHVLACDPHYSERLRGWRPSCSPSPAPVCCRGAASSSRCKAIGASTATGRSAALPWSTTSCRGAATVMNLGHNFVLAHEDCNHDKRDHLAGPEHLKRWCRRNAERGAELATRFDEAHLPHDWPTLRRVTASLYQLAEANRTSLWRQHSELVPIDGRWRTILGVA